MNVVNRNNYIFPNFIFIPRYTSKSNKLRPDDNVLFYLHGDITMLANYLATLFVILRVFS